MEADATWSGAAPVPTGPVRAGPLRGIQVFLGAFSIVVGLVALFWPEQTAVVVAVLFGLQLLVQAVVQLVRAVATPQASAAGRWVRALLGVLALVVGLLCLRDPLQTVVVLTLLLGLFWLADGLFEVVHAVLDGPRANALALAGGLAGIIAGTVVLVWPQPSAVVLALILGSWLLLFGVLAVIRGLRPVPEI